MIILLLLVFLVYLLFLAFYLRLMVDIAIIGRDLTTSSLAIKYISNFIKTYGKENGVMFDLGSCRGELLLGVAKICPGLRAYGVDNSRFRNFLARTKSRLLNRPIIFFLDNIFTADISRADVVYLYQKQSVVSALEEKFRKEMKAGSIVITNTYCLPTWLPAQTFITHPGKPEYEKLFIYVKK